MLIDSNLEMCDATSAALNTSDGITKVGDHIDIHPLTGDNATIDLSGGEPIYLVIEVTTAFVGSGANYKIDLTSSTETALTGGTTKNIWPTGTLAVNDDYWAAGERWIVSLPQDDYLRYLGIRATATSANVTAGNINAFITKDVTNWTSTNTRVNV